MDTLYGPRAREEQLRREAETLTPLMWDAVEKELDDLKRIEKALDPIYQAKPDTRKIRVVMPDQSEWLVPVVLVINDRHNYYLGLKGDHYHEKLMEESEALENWEIRDWAENNMNWDDVKEFATMDRPSSVDYQDGWVNGEKRIEN